MDTSERIIGLTWEEITNLQNKNDVRKIIDTSKQGDYGADPIGNDQFRMVPSGDIVNFEERNRRLYKD